MDRSAAFLVAFAALLLLAVLGGGGAWFLFSSRSEAMRAQEVALRHEAVARAAAEEAAAEADRARLELEEREAALEPRDVVPTEEPRVSEPEVGLISPALRAHAEQALRKGWRVERGEEMPPDLFDEGMRSFEERLLSLPFDIGAELGKRETAREEARADVTTGGVLGLLDELAAGGVGPMLPEVTDEKRFQRFFGRSAAESFLDGAPHLATLGDEITEGTTVNFPAGVFQPGALTDDQRRLAGDVTVRGAGMDATLLLMGDLTVRGRLRNLRIEDCTLYYERGGLLALRDGAASVSLNGVRLIGFDTGAGGSSAFGAKTLALHATGCELRGGFGRAPWSGRLFDVRNDGLLARFDQCRLELLHVDVRRFQKGATVVFSGCQFLDVYDDPQRDAAEKPGVVFQSCSFHPFEGDPNKLASRPVDELFPNWRERLMK